MNLHLVLVGTAYFKGDGVEPVALEPHERHGRGVVFPDTGRGIRPVGSTPSVECAGKKGALRNKLFGDVAEGDGKGLGLGLGLRGGGGPGLGLGLGRGSGLHGGGDLGLERGSGQGRSRMRQETCPQEGKRQEVRAGDAELVHYAVASGKITKNGSSNARILRKRLSGMRGPAVAMHFADTCPAVYRHTVHNPVLYVNANADIFSPRRPFYHQGI